MWPLRPFLSTKLPLSSQKVTVFFPNFTFKFFFLQFFSSSSSSSPPSLSLSLSRPHTLWSPFPIFSVTKNLLELSVLLLNYIWDCLLFSIHQCTNRHHFLLSNPTPFNRLIPREGVKFDLHTYRNCPIASPFFFSFFLSWFCICSWWLGSQCAETIEFVLYVFEGLECWLDWLARLMFDGFGEWDDKGFWLNFEEHKVRFGVTLPTKEWLDLGNSGKEKGSSGQQKQKG